jgi:hypothetical protein
MAANHGLNDWHSSIGAAAVEGVHRNHDGCGKVLSDIRVVRGNLTLALSENWTLQSPVIQLLLSSLSLRELPIVTVCDLLFGRRVEGDIEMGNRQILRCSMGRHIITEIPGQDALIEHGGSLLLLKYLVDFF